jgi:hypothetical protein
MLAQTQRFKNLENLREFVNNILCYYNQLEPGAFRLTERLLVRGGKPCGILFCLHGPRSVKLTAIWETDHNRILFYGCTGERFHKTQLLAAPRLQMADAE